MTPSDSRNKGRGKGRARPGRGASPRRSPRLGALPLGGEAAWRRLFPILAALIYAAVMLPLALHYHAIGDHGVETDFYGGLVQESQQIAHGELAIDRFKGPVYGLTLAAVTLPVGDSFTAAVILSVLSAALALFFTAKTIARLFGRAPALLTVLGMAVNAQFVKYSYTASTDMLFNLWMVASAYFVLRRDEPSRRDLTIAGLFGGLAYLTRYAGAAALLWAPVAILLLLGGRFSWRRWAAGTGLFFAGALSLVVPWLVYCKIRAGSFIVNDNYMNAAFGIYAAAGTNWEVFWRREADNFHSFIDVVFRDPALFLKTIVRNLPTHAWYDIGFKGNDPGTTVKLPTAILSLMHPAMGALALPGFAAWVLSRPRRAQIAYVALGGFYLAVLLAVFYGSRFSLFLVPMYALLAALLLLRIPWGRMGEFGELARAVVIAGVLVIVAMNTVTVIRGDIASGPTVVLRMRDELRAGRIALEKGSILVARKPHIAYYLGMEYRVFPDVETVSELMQELHRMNARYLYYGPNEWLLRSRFRFLLDPSKAPRGLVPVIALDGAATNEPAVLYEVEASTPGTTRR